MKLKKRAQNVTSLEEKITNLTKKAKQLVKRGDYDNRDEECIIAKDLLEHHQRIIDNFLELDKIHSNVFG